MLQSEPNRAYYGWDRWIGTITGRIPCCAQLYTALHEQTQHTHTHTPSLSLSGRVKHVERANDANAIETLMVTDELFRYLLCQCYSRVPDCVTIHWLPHYVDQRMCPRGRDMLVLWSLSRTMEAQLGYSQVCTSQENVSQGLVLILYLSCLHMSNSKPVLIRQWGSIWTSWVCLMSIVMLQFTQS